MRTLRGRMTAWFAAALVLAMMVFAVALYTELRRPSLIELDDRVQLESQLGLRWLIESHRVIGSLVRARRPADSTVVIDSLELRDVSGALLPSIGAYFESYRDYVVIFDGRGVVLFTSEPLRVLGFPALERLAEQVPTPARAVPPTTLSLDVPGGGVRYTVQPVTNAGEDIGAILIAAPLTSSSFDPRVLLRAMLVVSPIIVLCAIAMAYWLSGNALNPVRGLMDEVDAIKDGRSLHRRLAVPLSNDEIARLALTVNGMLARLEQSFESLHRFTADASHELKTPMMVLRAGVERALTHPETPAEIMPALDETLEQLNRMSEMVENLLTLARADEGRAPLSVESVDLRTIVEDVAETAGLLADGQGVSVAFDVPADPVMLDVDTHRIRELALNLASNAVKYTPRGGAVSLQLSDQLSDVQLQVQDSGIGIAPGDLPHIFDRFWRADPARSRTGDRPGVGLGLAITKWIAEAHGGSISVESRPGRGTVFTVRLPREATTTVPPASR